MSGRWDEPLEAPAGVAAEAVGVPRWRPGLTFGEFAELTVRDYYPPAAPAAKGPARGPGARGQPARAPQPAAPSASRPHEARQPTGPEQDMAHFV